MRIPWRYASQHPATCLYVTDREVTTSQAVVADTVTPNIVDRTDLLYLVTHGFHTQGFRNAIRNALQFRRHADDTCWLAEKYNRVLIACGTSAARRWLPQALALPIFSTTFLSNGKRLWCNVGALL